jgi:tetratricopeptide (TPR) repeat protein
MLYLDGAEMRIKSLFVLASLLFLILLTDQQASAQTIDELLHSDDGIVNDETCTGGTPLAGAASVRVIVRGNEEVLLVGARGNRVVWKKQFPLPEEVNTPKTNPVCKGRTIQLYSQFPFSAYTRIYTFTWDGHTLKYVSTRSEDPSAETLEEALAAAETGNVRKLKSLYGGENYLPIFYPAHYIGYATLADAIKRGHTAATRLYKAGKSLEAADRLALMFDLTVALANTVSGDTSSTSAAPDKWLQAWKSLEVDKTDYIYALNDYGFFLQQAGEDARAVPIFNIIIKEDPSRAVAYLNLADSLWALERKTEARSHYKTYQRLMMEAKKGDQIPSRVAERSG